MYNYLDRCTLTCSVWFITARKRSCGKVMFLQVCVILFTGGACVLFSGGCAFFQGCACFFRGGVHAFFGGVWFFRGACVVFLGGMVFSGGLRGFFRGWACMVFSWGYGQ